jgi:hypothetical protein
MTTVASAFTAARFVKGEAISGNPLGLRIAAGNVSNPVNLETGGWGEVIVDAGNSTWTTTLANFDTLASLITAFATLANDDWHTRFFKAATPTGGATPKNTLEAMAGIARTPWANPTALYALFDEAYPQPKDGSRRAAPFAPYLAYTPTDFTLSLWFGGGGSYANGNMVFDAEGNMWCGQNWMAGSQSGVRKSIGGAHQPARFAGEGNVGLLADRVTLEIMGIGARGVALDSKGNLWVTSLMSPDFPLPKIPAGVSIMQHRSSWRR